MTSHAMDWLGIDAHPRFQELHQKKSRFLWTLMLFSVAYYFMLPIGAAYFTGVFKIKLWGPVNVGIVFALSEFVVAWVVAYAYARVASRRFDPMAAEIAREAHTFGGAR